MASAQVYYMAEKNRSPVKLQYTPECLYMFVGMFWLSVIL